jgi:hypothetical protein
MWDIIEASRIPPWEDICAELHWERYTVGGAPFTERHHGYRGVYRIFGLTTENDPRTPAVINRAFGSDSNGTLYIGKAKFFDLRLNKFRLSRGHKAADLLRACSFLRTAFPHEKLGVAMFTTGAADTVERDLISAYLNSFGDTPPLNCSY